LHLEPEAFSPLGAGVYLSPGVLGEKIFFMKARIPEPVGALSRPAPAVGDGTPAEEGALVQYAPLPSALAAVRAGAITDIKTEVALRRLAEDTGLR
jgi:ADP-ribose pyrophosphatase